MSRLAASSMDRLDSIDRWLGFQVDQAVSGVWLRWARQGSAEAEYLWFKRGAIEICRETPGEGYELGDSERVPSHLERAALVRWVLERVRRLPCLPEETKK